MKKILFKLAGIVSCLAMVITTMQVNQTCAMLIHQPKLPQGAKNLRKF